MDKLIKLDFSKLSPLDKEIYKRMPYLFDNSDNVDNKDNKNININEFLKLSESNNKLNESNNKLNESIHNESKDIDV